MASYPLMIYIRSKQSEWNIKHLKMWDPPKPPAFFDYLEYDHDLSDLDKSPYNCWGHWGSMIAGYFKIENVLRALYLIFHFYTSIFTACPCYIHVIFGHNTWDYLTSMRLSWPNPNPPIYLSGFGMSTQTLILWPGLAGGSTISRLWGVRIG